jgi:hypothetical protein
MFFTVLSQNFSLVRGLWASVAHTPCGAPVRPAHTARYYIVFWLCLTRVNMQCSKEYIFHWILPKHPFPKTNKKPILIGQF